MRVITGQKQPIELDSAYPLGKGGEATIFCLKESTNLCAKIYRDDQKASKLQNKIFAMIDIYKHVKQSEGETKVVFDKYLAWPRQMLFRDENFCGFVMNKLFLGADLSSYLTPEMSAEKSWANRLKIAENLLKVLSILHSLNIIAVDLHKGNIFILPNNEVALFDCDSFQISNDFPYSALQPEVSLPEAKHVEYLSPAADVFNAAVLIYRLLMDGFSPFQYVQEGNIQPDLEQSKAAGLAPIRNAKLQLPPASPLLKDRLSKKAAEILARALDPDAKLRPTLSELRTAIEDVRKTIKTSFSVRTQVHSPSTQQAKTNPISTSSTTAQTFPSAVQLPRRVKTHSLIRFKWQFIPALSIIGGLIGFMITGSYTDDLLSSNFIQKWVGFSNNPFLSMSKDNPTNAHLANFAVDVLVIMIPFAIVALLSLLAILVEEFGFVFGVWFGGIIGVAVLLFIQAGINAVLVSFSPKFGFSLAGALCLSGIGYALSEKLYTYQSNTSKNVVVPIWAITGVVILVQLLSSQSSLTTTLIHTKRTQLKINSSVIAKDVGSNKEPFGIATAFREDSISHGKLIYYIKYEGAVANRTKFKALWYRDGSIIGNSQDSALKYASGNFWNTFNYNFTPGNYEVRLFVDGDEVDRKFFSVQAKAVPDSETADSMKKQAEDARQAAEEIQKQMQKSDQSQTKIFPQPPSRPFPASASPPTVPKSFSVSIQSFPSEATVYINRESKGTTPLSLNLKEGSYGIKIVKEGYKVFYPDRPIDVSEYGKKKYYWTLEKE